MRKMLQCLIYTFLSNVTYDMYNVLHIIFLVFYVGGGGGEGILLILLNTSLQS